MAKKRKWKNLAEYTLLRLLAAFARLLPRSTALALGARLGQVAALFLPGKKRLARESMRLAFPEQSATQINRQVVDLFRHLGISGMEMLRLNLMTDDDLERLFSVQGLEHLRQAYDMHRGVILLSGHIGFWEVGSFFFPRLGFPANYVAKRMKNPYVDDYFTRMREACGASGIDKRNGARKILRALLDKRAVAVLIDQHASPADAVIVDFLGRPAYTTPIITRLAMKQRVPVVPIFVFRRPDNTYEVRIEPIMHLDPEGDVTENTRLLTAPIEAAIRREPSQWLWLHRRWRVPQASR
jgi:Kdo2-lipid IVA lauroyltransferase/acyltransferase